MLKIKSNKSNNPPVMEVKKYDTRTADKDVPSKNPTRISLNRKILHQNINIPSLTKKKKRNSPSRRRKARGVNKNEKKKGGPTSVVKHDMPMGKRDLYFALDCEMVGVGPYGAKSALARVSIVNWDCDVVLDTFVKVPVPVTDYRTFVSGITSEDLESGEAMDLEDVRTKVQNILRGKILIGHALGNDLNALTITHPWCDTRDTANYLPFMREIVDHQNRRMMTPRRLKDLTMEELGREIQVLGDAHSSVEDAIAALELYKGARPKWEAFMCEQVNKANELETTRRQKALSFMKRRVQPMVMYDQPMQAKSFTPQIVPLSPPNMPVPYLPPHGQAFYPHYKPQINQRMLPRMIQNHPPASLYISTN